MLSDTVFHNDPKEAHSASNQTDVDTPAAACVTVTVCEATPVADTVTVAERAEPVFSCAVTVTVALFEPDVGLTVSHV